MDAPLYKKNGRLEAKGVGVAGTSTKNRLLNRPAIFYKKLTPLPPNQA